MRFTWELSHVKMFEWVPLAHSIHNCWNWMPNCFKAKSIQKPSANSLKDFFLRKLVATFSHRFFLFHQLPRWLDCLAPLTSQWPAIPLQQKSSLGANIKGETSAIQCNSRIITARPSATALCLHLCSRSFVSWNLNCSMKAWCVSTRRLTELQSGSRLCRVSKLWLA